MNRVILLGWDLFYLGANDWEPPRMSTREQLRATLLNLLEEEMGEPYPLLTDDQDLRESLNLDSVDVVGLVMRIEREFRVRLATEELAAVKRVGDLLDVMEAKLVANPGGPATGPPEPQPGLNY
jgi:acyl carrier protein